LTPELTLVQMSERIEQKFDVTVCTRWPLPIPPPTSKSDTTTPSSSTMLWPSAKRSFIQIRLGSACDTRDAAGGARANSGLFKPPMQDLTKQFERRFLRYIKAISPLRDVVLVLDNAPAIQILRMRLTKRNSKKVLRLGPNSC
ncbi:hypothetical protein GN958_ATG05384, partial [Phytophthora infestans]